MGDFPRITSLKIDGFKVFDKLDVELGPLEVIVGANGSGKSSLFELLKFIRNGMNQQIPPDIIPGVPFQNIFTKPGIDVFSWSILIGIINEKEYSYEAKIRGPRGRPEIISEQGIEYGNNEQGVLDATDAFLGGLEATQEDEIDKPGWKPPRRLLLGHIFHMPGTGYGFDLLRDHITRWSFYSSFNINDNALRGPVLIQEEPILEEDGNNLSAVLHYYLTEYPHVIDELITHLQSVIPGFDTLMVKARGGPGGVMAFWREEGVDADLTLADLSDGILRFLCWAVLCLHPKPPTLICIDEPELGLHPRVLPLLAGLFQKASQRTQVLIATHSSYFLSQFPLESIAVMRKEEGRAVWKKPADSAALKANLEEFGQDEIEFLHRSNELEERA